MAAGPSSAGHAVLAMPGCAGYWPQKKAAAPRAISSAAPSETTSRGVTVRRCSGTGLTVPESDALIRPPAAQLELRRTTRSVSLQHHVAGFNQPRRAAGTRAPQATSAVTLCDQVACDP